MGDLRKERIAVNEGLFRNANERTAEWDEVRDSDEPVLYVCECANPDCRRRIRLTREEYERVRQDSKHFAATQGHQIADAETVIEDHGDWVVIEKHDDVVETVRAMDQRSN
jgi:O-succinylbenzoate synthase